MGRLITVCFEVEDMKQAGVIWDALRDRTPLLGSFVKMIKEGDHLQEQESETVVQSIDPDFVPISGYISDFPGVE